MIINYFKTALRNIARNKLFTFLNVLGLSLGLATAILILFWVQDELSYDRYHQNAKNIYRITADYQLPGEKFKGTTTCPPMAGTLINDYPEIINACRFNRNIGGNLSVGDQKFSISKLAYVDSTFFDLFSVTLLKGDKKNLLNHPNYLVLSETTAKQLYGEKDPIGELVKVGDESFLVTGIYADIPENSHFHFNILLSMSSLKASLSPIWLDNNYYTYIQLHADANPKKLEQEVQKTILKHIGPALENATGQTMDKLVGNGSISFQLQKLTDIHLHSHLMGEIDINGNLSNIYIFSFIALFILIIACINFMNMSTARSESRSKEVGIRKVSGAARGQIIFQFLLESFMITLLSYFFAMILIEIYLPSFNTLSGKNITINYFEPYTLFILLGIIISTSFISGSYPAFYLSSFQPIETLKGTLKSGKSSGRLRNVLVIIQFFTTIILISSSIFVYNQLKFIQTKELGFVKEQLICIGNLNALGDKANTFKQELLNHPEVLSATISSFLPVPSAGYHDAVYPDGDKNNIVGLYQWFVDVDYIETLKMNIKTGRNFLEESGTDLHAVLINETALKQFGWESYEGHFITRKSSQEAAKYKVIGVLENFHFESLKKSISPMIMQLGEGGYYLTLRYNATNAQDIIELTEKKWKEFAPNDHFDYSFINDRFNNMYSQEQQIGKIMKIFTFLAIIVASLGLFGLAAFIAEKRTKEIGIRKVNGASLLNIFMLFTKIIAKLILIAFILAVPLTWYIINEWLNNFTYRVDINWLVFVGAGILSFLIAILTISYQAYKASSQNPIESLKYE